MRRAKVGNGVVGISPNRGVWGVSSAGNGVQGQSESWSGVSGFSSTAEGVRGVSLDGPGVYGHSYRGPAGVFEGDVHVTGTIFKGALAFKIDHPLDPTNKYLYQSGVESPEMKNVYDGIAVLDRKGGALVVLPLWFEALNGDFRYQLTAIGGAPPGLHVAQEIAKNRFRIAGGAPRMKVCWQITGIRRDPYAKAHPVPVEQAKPAHEKGLFLHPRALRQSEKKGIRLGTAPETVNVFKKRFEVIKKLFASGERKR